MEIATVPGTSKTTERVHGVLHRRSPARQQPNGSRRQVRQTQRQGVGHGKLRSDSSPHWQDNDSQLAAGKSAAAPRAARLHPTGASPNRLTGATPSPVKHKFSSPGASPPSDAHFEHGTWYQRRQGNDGPPPLRSYPEAVAESWEQHQQSAVLYEEALQHKRRTLGNTHASTLMSIRKLAELCEIRGDVVQAEVLFAEAFAGHCRKHGDDHADTVTAERDLARVRDKCAEKRAQGERDPSRRLTDRQVSAEISAMLEATISVAVDDAVAAPYPPSASLSGSSAPTSTGCKPAETWRGVEQATSVREIFREVPVGLHLDAQVQQARESTTAAQLFQLQRANDLLQTRVNELESALAASEEAKRVSDRQHQWEVQQLKRKVMELAATGATTGRASQPGSGAGRNEGGEGGSDSVGTATGSPQQRKLLLVRQLEYTQKAHAREVALLQSKLRRYEDAAAD